MRRIGETRTAGTISRSRVHVGVRQKETKDCPPPQKTRSIRPVATIVHTVFAGRVRDSISDRIFSDIFEFLSFFSLFLSHSIHTLI